MLANIPTLWQTSTDAVQNRFLRRILDAIQIRHWHEYFDVTIVWFNKPEDQIRVYLPHSGDLETLPKSAQPRTHFVPSGLGGRWPLRGAAAGKNMRVDLERIAATICATWTLLETSG
jgi:hypothetical protein